MSVAGKRSSQGDEYQLRVALHWLIRLINDDDLSAIQVESVALPGQITPTAIDDVVVIFRDGHREYIQAKKNQINHQYWRLSDHELQGELVKMREQLESDPTGRVLFYSRSPFGEFKKLVEECIRLPEYAAFEATTSTVLKKRLDELAQIIGRSTAQAFLLAKRVGFGGTFEFEEWDRENRACLDRIVPWPEQAQLVLERYLASHGASLRDARTVMQRSDVIAELQRHGLYPSANRSEQEIMESFAQASSIGRSWPREIGGERIPRPELGQIIKCIEQGDRTILVTDRPGSGKTCLLLDLADQIEQLPTWGLLFIKGDQFSDVTAESDLTSRGIPEDVVGQCARLATSRRVVVILDSLDVLSSDRNHGALRTFLRLIDRLKTVTGLSVVAACREFDLRYDPLLRDRQWGRKVPLQALDYESVVAPLLQRWGIDASVLDRTLQELLRTPQHLRLFERIATRRSLIRVASAHELYQHFIEEMISKDPQLGRGVLAQLQTLAGTLLRRRTQVFPRAELQLDEPVLQRLESVEILMETSPGTLSFGHQTLAEALVVQDAVARGQTLSEFIAEHPALPFIRPAVRAFFFFLRAYNAESFRKQVRAVIAHPQIAYHLKRLVAESIAEIVPANGDWPLLRWLFSQHSDLFQRFLSHTKGVEWFRFLVSHWLPEAKSVHPSEDWPLRLLNHSRVWVKDCPAELVAFWQDELTPQKDPRFAQQIAFGLDDFDDWHTPGLRQLFEMLLGFAQERDFLGKPLSRWIAATNQGDDLLWQFIVRDVTLTAIQGFGSGADLRCESHKFFSDTFLQARLCQSDELLSLALMDLTRWSAEADAGSQSRSRSVFLYSTSWKRRHSAGLPGPVDGISELLQGVEAALKAHATRDDAWWRENEPRLRSTSERGLRYLVLEAYKESVSTNACGIEAQLTELALIRDTNLSYEMGELMLRAYPCISDEAQEANQRAILAIGQDIGGEAEHAEWMYKSIYDLLVWIPGIFRIPEAQQVVEQWRDRFGHVRPTPELYMWGGFVAAPVPAATLLDFSDECLVRLLHHYNRQVDSEMTGSGSSVGGRRQLENVLRRAASMDPERFLGLIQRLFQEQLHRGYVHDVVGGVADHVRYKVGSLNPDHDWKPVDPSPSVDVLARRLLAFAESQIGSTEPMLGKDELAMCGSLDACCQVLHDQDSAERLTLLLFRMLNADSPSPEHDRGEQDAQMTASNSARGKAAEAAMVLCNHLLNGQRQLPELLPHLLQHFSRDPSPGVRLSILWRLPFLMHKRPETGWKLLERLLREPRTPLWRHVEDVFYHQYRENFELLKPFLDRMREQGLEKAGGTYGRIATLSSLAGHIPQEELFETLATTNDDAWSGAAQVFCANLSRQEHRSNCLGGLHGLVERGPCPASVLNTIISCFGEQNTGTFLDFRLARALLSAIDEGPERHVSIGGLLEWLEHSAHRDLTAVLEAVEAVAALVERKANRVGILESRPLVATLLEILREADESDDSELVRRAIQLQDSFLRLNVHGMDDLLDRASKN